MAIFKRKEKAAERVTQDPWVPTLLGNIVVVLKNGQYYCLENEFHLDDGLNRHNPEVWLGNDRYELLQGVTQELLDNYNLWRGKWAGSTFNNFCKKTYYTYDNGQVSGLKKEMLYVKKIYTMLEVIEMKKEFYKQKTGTELAQEWYHSFYEIAKNKCLNDPSRVAETMLYHKEFIQKKLSAMTVGDLDTDYDTPLSSLALAGRDHLSQELQNTVGIELLTQLIYLIKESKPDFVEKPRTALQGDPMPAIQKDLLAAIVEELKHTLQSAG